MGNDSGTSASRSVYSNTDLVDSSEKEISVTTIPGLHKEFNFANKHRPKIVKFSPGVTINIFSEAAKCLLDISLPSVSYHILLST